MFDLHSFKFVPCLVLPQELNENPPEMLSSLRNIRSIAGQGITGEWRQ